MAHYSDSYKRSKIPIPESQFISQRGLFSDISDEVFYDVNKDYLTVPSYKYGKQQHPQPPPSYNFDRTRTFQVTDTIKRQNMPGPSQPKPQIPEVSKPKKKRKKKISSRIAVEKKLDELIAKIEEEKRQRKAAMMRKSSKSMENLKAPSLLTFKRISSSVERKKSASIPRLDLIDPKLKPIRRPPLSRQVLPLSLTSALPSKFGKKPKLSHWDDETKYVKAGGQWRKGRSVPLGGAQAAASSKTPATATTTSAKLTGSDKKTTPPDKKTPISKTNVKQKPKVTPPKKMGTKIKKAVAPKTSTVMGVPSGDKKSDDKSNLNFSIKVIKDGKEIPLDEIKDKIAIIELFELCKKSDWHTVEQSLRYFEKIVLTGENSKPLDGVTEEENGWTPLMYAVKEGRLPIVERMTRLGCDLNAPNKAGETPLILAATFAKDETVRFLLFKKVDITAQTFEKKETAIHMASKRASGDGTNILKSLLIMAPKEARFIKDADGNIPLITALEANNRSACSNLLNVMPRDQLTSLMGPEQNTPLHVAILKKDIEIARTFVNAGAYVDAKNLEGLTPLHLAAETGSIALVKFFYMCKANPNVADKKDRTPIHIAAENGHTDIINMLADKFKVSVQSRTKDGSTLMHIASLHGHPETAMALFKRGVPLQMPNKDGERGIHIAAKNGHGPLIKRLVDNGESVDATTNDNYTALHIAVENEKPSVIEALIGYGAEVQIKGGKQAETPLHISARVADGTKCAQMLLKSGAEPNITMDNGETPLHIAARHGRLKIIRLLLNNGADLLRKSKNGETSLHMCCKYGHVQTIKVLLQFLKDEKGEKGDKAVKNYINSVTEKGESPLHYASKLCRSFPGKTITDDGREIATILLNGGGSTGIQTTDNHETPFHYCSREGNNEILLEMIGRMVPVDCQRAINRQTTKGWSPLLLACHKGHLEVVKSLLSNAARVDVFDNEGRSALHLAAEHGYQEVCKLLLDHKAYINAKSKVGFTSLHYAAKKGYKKLCIFLIQEYQASVDVVTLSKQTPLHLAAEAGQLDVCRLLMGLKANADAGDEKGQKPIHLAAQNNHSDVIKLFLKHKSTLVTSSTKDGSTCAHLAAMQGSIAVLEELMKFDKNGVISARNRTTDATALQLAAEGGHAELVKALLNAGASATDENKIGYAAVHSAAKNGHINVIETLLGADAVQLISRKVGLNALHIASHFGQADLVRELLVHISATTLSEPPASLQASFLKDLGLESGLTPLHFAAYAGEENVVRLLLNYPGVQVNAPTINFGYNPCHLACIGGHVTVVGLLLSRSSELLEMKDKSGKTGLHHAATEGHLQMCEILLGQGAEIDSVDKEMWTPLMCSAKAGHLQVIKLLLESGASPLAKNSKGQPPIWFAAAESHIPSLMYLMRNDHDTYGLMEDNEFLFNMTICGKNTDNEPIDLFILSSPAPVDIAANLSATLEFISTKEKERAKDLILASEYCEDMAAELLALASCAESPAKILRSVDKKNREFLDVLIEIEKKEVIAHTVVQRFLQELWVGGITWGSGKLLLLFLLFIINPVIWVVFTLPLGHKYYKIPIIKFMSYLTSHIHMMILISLTSTTPIHDVLPIRIDLFPYWYEWMLLIWLTGLCWGEFTNPSDKSGLGIVKVIVIFFSVLGTGVHFYGYFMDAKDINTGTLLYARNQLFALANLCACVQILDFLSFHQMFGPFPIIIGNLMNDLVKFMAVLTIFLIGFSMQAATLNYPLFERAPGFDRKSIKTLTRGLSGLILTPIDCFELLFFGLFGLAGPPEIMLEPAQPEWTSILYKMFFGIYLLVTVIVLINLLIAMMSDTYCAIQEKADIEWKFALAKLIRNMHRTVATPSPINIFTAWLIWIFKKLSLKKEPYNPLKLEMKGTTRGGAFNKGKNKKGWKSLFTSSSVSPESSDMGFSSANITQGASQGSLGQCVQRIEHVVDWPMISKKYRALVGKEEVIDDEESKEEKEKGKKGSSSTIGGSSAASFA